MPSLTRDDRETAVRLILECYDQTALGQLLRVRFDLHLGWVVRDARMADQVAEFLDLADRHRLTGSFLKEAAEYPPPKAKLQPLAARYPPDPDAPPRPADELIKEAVGAFKVVPGLLKEDEARQLFAPFVTAYQDAAKHIDLL